MNQFHIAYWQLWAQKHGYDPSTVDVRPKPFTEGYDVFVEGE
jgi:hypothetical protein